VAFAGPVVALSDALVLSILRLILRGAHDLSKKASGYMKAPHVEKVVIHSSASVALI
jgi:hypothetical protein